MVVGTSPSVVESDGTAGVKGWWDGTAGVEDWRVSTLVEKTGVRLDVASGSLQSVLKLVDGREYLPFSWSRVFHSRMSLNQNQEHQTRCCTYHNSLGRAETETMLKYQDWGRKNIFKYKETYI